MGTWWNPHIRKFFKTLPCCQFSLRPFSFKIHFRNFRIFLKKFQSLYDFFHSLNFWSFFLVRKQFRNRKYKWVFRGAPFSPNSGHPRSFCKNKIPDDFLNLIQYFFLNSRLLEIDISHIKYFKICLFEGDMFFQIRTYCTCWILGVYLAWLF